METVPSRKSESLLAVLVVQMSRDFFLRLLHLLGGSDDDGGGGVDPDTQYLVLSAARRLSADGGPLRIGHTTPPIALRAFRQVRPSCSLKKKTPFLLQFFFSDGRLLFYFEKFLLALLQAGQTIPWNWGPG